jgi:hypothetical protein
MPRVAAPTNPSNTSANTPLEQIFQLLETSNEPVKKPLLHSPKSFASAAMAKYERRFHGQALHNFD